MWVKVETEGDLKGIKEGDKVKFNGMDTKVSSVLLDNGFYVEDYFVDTTRDENKYFSYKIDFGYIPLYKWVEEEPKMKFEDLTKEEQEHLKRLIDKHGLPPEGTTHFDLGDTTNSSWMKKVDVDYQYYSGDGTWCFYNHDKDFTKLPELPYYKPEDVCFNYDIKISTHDQSSKSDGSTASYYKLPSGCLELQQLISHRNMNAQLGEIFRACYRYGLVEHSEMLRDAKKIKFYAEAEIERLEKLNGNP